MPSAYDYATTTGYGRARSDWVSWGQAGQTLIRQSDLDQFDQALFDLKSTVVNVRDFGAKADGSTDDTTAIQNALNAVSSKGGTLYFPVGTYKITSTITYAGTGPVWIRGHGMEASAGGQTKIKASLTGTYTAIGTTGYNGVLVFANASNVNHFRFENFYVDMTGLTNTIGLYVDNIGYSTFQRLKFREGGIGFAGLRIAGCIMDDLHAWNQATYGFAQLYTDGTHTVTTNGQANSWRDCEYRMTSAVNNTTAGFAVLSGQQDVNFTNCHAQRQAAVATGAQYGFFFQGPVSTWPPDGTWAGECHLVHCNADAIADSAGDGAGFWFENYRHVRVDQTWSSAMDTTNAWYQPAIVVKNCQDIAIRGCEISSNGLQLQSNVDLLIVANNHFLNAGTTTTSLTIGSATLTNLVFSGNTKKVTGAAWCDSMSSLRTARQYNNNVEGPVAAQAVTASGTALINGTQTLLSWAAPNDGQMHGFVIVGSLEVATNETGGQITFTYTHNGTANTIQLVAASQVAGTFSIFAGRVCDPNTTVTVSQASALTAGSSTVSAAILAS